MKGETAFEFFLLRNLTLQSIVPLEKCSIDFFFKFCTGFSINDTYDTGIKYIYVTLKSQTSKYDFKYINSTELFMHITRFEADGLAYFYVPQTFFSWT